MSDPWRKAWLASTDEPVIDPDRPIVDPHHHLWDEFANLPRPYLPADFCSDVLSGQRIEATVYVEVPGAGYYATGPAEMRPVGETEWVLERANELVALGGPRIGAIVGFADLLRGAAIQPVLEAHIAAGQGRFAGVRQGAAYDPSERIPDYCPPGGCCYPDAGFRSAVELAGRMGLVFEAWNYHPHISDLTALARACPETLIVLDHYGGPLGSGPYAGKRDEVFADWRSSIAALARCPNVVIKLGGLAMPVNGFGWHRNAAPPGSAELAESQRPFFEHALACFGPDRAMFESNYPVEKISVSYRVLWNAFKRLAAALSEGEKDALFRNTARRVYKLDERV